VLSAGGGGVPAGCELPLEYFARAVGWLRAQPVAQYRSVILYGVSPFLGEPPYFPYSGYGQTRASPPPWARRAATSG
jgi:hypothetical protein